MCMLKSLNKLELNSIYGVKKVQLYFFPADGQVICYHLLMTSHILGQFLEPLFHSSVLTAVLAAIPVASACILGF